MLLDDDVEGVDVRFTSDDVGRSAVKSVDDDVFCVEDANAIGFNSGLIGVALVVDVDDELDGEIGVGVII